jgi:hypothetical protein
LKLWNPPGAIFKLALCSDFGMGWLLSAAYVTSMIVLAKPDI